MVLTEQSEKTPVFLVTFLVLNEICVCLESTVDAYWKIYCLIVFVFITLVFALRSDVIVCSVFCLFTEIAVACGHFSAALHLCVEPGEDPDKQAFSK